MACKPERICDQTRRPPFVEPLEWTNNLDTKVNDLGNRAKISGNALNRKTISTDQGFYNSSEDTIIWDKNSHE